jgi:DNA gyrase/topoisomerase IV subunit B
MNGIYIVPKEVIDNSTDEFQFSVGLDGIATKAVNALSGELEVISYREGKFVECVAGGMWIVTWAMISG